MKRLVILPMLAVLAIPETALPQTPPRAQEGGCSTYFGVLQDDPRVPGRYVSRMTSSQASWYAKSGLKQHPGVCLGLEKARYLVIWTISTETRTIYTAETRTASTTTLTNGHENGAFNTYGALSMWGTYSGTSSSSSTSTTFYQESVPVTIAADHCSVYVLKSVGATIWDDIKSSTPAATCDFLNRGSWP
jgi:hypothetical protein